MGGYPGRDFIFDNIMYYVLFDYVRLEAIYIILPLLRKVKALIIK